jgi:hypothetical protein
VYLPFRAEFAASTRCRNNFPLRSCQVFIARIKSMLGVPRLYTLDVVKHDFSTYSWSRVNRSGLRTRLFSHWHWINWPSLRWDLHTSHSDLCQWTKPTHGALKSPLHAAIACLLIRFFFFYGDDSWALVCAAFMRGFQTSAPNSAGYQQHVSALFARV